MKLWKKQQKGKKKLAERGSVQLDSATYRKIFLNKD
jgi:translation elongation factor EF-4